MKLDETLGKNLYNQSGLNAGKVIAIQIYEDDSCFVVDEQQSPYYQSQVSHIGKYWQVSRWGSEVFIGSSLDEVLQLIYKKAQQIEDPAKRQAQVQLIEWAREKEPVAYEVSRFEWFQWDAIEECWDLVDDSIRAYSIKHVEEAILGRSAILSLKEPHGYYYSDIHGAKYILRDMNRHAQLPSELPIYH